MVKTMNRIGGAVALVAMLGLAACAGKPRPQNDGKSRAANAGPAGKTDHGAEVCRLVSESDEIVSILENGATVIVKRVASPVVSVRGYVKAGGVYEGQWLGGGVSHLLEHLVAGGTNDRRTEADNRNLLQQIGNNSNAYTYSDHTAYFVNTTAENLDKAADLVTGWMLGAAIPPEEYQREHEVVQRELEMDNGEPGWVFYCQSVRNRYRVSPAGVPTIGYGEVIRGLRREDVCAYHKLAYQPNNMVFAVAGNLEPEVMLKAVRKHVGGVAAGRAFSHEIAGEPPVLAPRTAVCTFPKLGQAKLELAFPTIRLTDGDLYALDLLATVLTRGQSSLLVEEVRDRRQLVSVIAASSFTPDYVEGTFCIYMELAPEKIAEATAAVLAQLEKIKKEGAGEDRLQRAKTQTRTARAFDQQTTESVAQSMASDYLSTGDAHFSDRYVDRMQGVTEEQIKAAAVKYLEPSRLLTTAMLPEEAVKGGGPAGAEELLRAPGPSSRPSTRGQSEGSIRKVELRDGTTVLLKRVATAPIVVMQMYSLGGLTAEEAETNGLGNLVMQMTPRGTRSRSARQIAEFYDSIGGELSASCGNNTWSWSATCLKDDLAKAMEVFADVVRNPTFPETEIGPMKRRIVAAIEGQDADWFAQSMRFFRKAYFGPRGLPYQFMPIGSKENVERFTAEQMRQWHAEKILGARRVLGVFGDIEVEKARELVEERFGPRAAAGVNKNGEGSVVIKPKSNHETPTISVRRVEVQKTQNPQAGVVIGFDSNSVVGDPDDYALTVADTMASGYDYPTGYLFEALRGQGLVYDVQAHAFHGRSGQYPGAFTVYAGCEAKNVNEVVELILENIARLQGQAADLGPVWFERSKKLIITSDALANETAAAQATTAALDELFGLGWDYHGRFADRIDAVALGEVQGVARRLLRQCVVTVNTSAPEAVGIQAGERKYGSFRPVDLTPRGVQHDSGAASR